MDGNGWIKVTDRLPEERDERNADTSIDVLGVNGNKATFVYYDWVDEEWRTSYGDNNCDVTHWQLLPPPPAQD